VNPDKRTLAWISWVLRIGVVMEFVGHGALGIGRVASWTSYFAVVGINKETAEALMPWVGVFDVAMAMTVLFYPMRAVILYMGFWGLWTALLRPLAGETAWEAVERAGNYGALAALFLLAKGGGRLSWLRFNLVRELPFGLEQTVSWVLRLTTALLLAGHGALGLILNAPVHGVRYEVLGLHGASVQPLIGLFECGLGLAVLFRPGFGLLVFAVVWKVATEILAPMAGSPAWVFVEHGGSYAAPLALAIMIRFRLQPEGAALRDSDVGEPEMSPTGSAS
jgi:hypothetical protein